MYGTDRTELTLSEGYWSEKHPVGSCAYCRTSDLSAYYALLSTRIIRHWLCQECVTEARATGLEVRAVPCFECRVPSDRHHGDHAYLAPGLGR